MCLHMQICMCVCICLLVYFGYSCPFSVVLKVRWPPVACCNWSYATVWDCMHVCDAIGIVFLHTYRCRLHFRANKLLTGPQHAVRFLSLFNFAALFGYFTLCATFVCGSKATFAFISMRRRSHVCVWMCASVLVTSSSTDIKNNRV